MAFSSNIPVSAVGYSTAMGEYHNLCNTKLKLNDQAWYSASDEPQTIYVLFDGPCLLQQFDLLEIGSDMTTHGFAWDAHRILALGRFSKMPIYKERGYNIRRGSNRKGAMGFSSDNPGDSHRMLKEGWVYARDVDDPLEHSLPEALPAIGVRIRITAGHGWFGAVGLALKGIRQTRFDSRQLAKYVGWVRRESGVLWQPEQLAT